MKILLGLWHPAHVHTFRNAVWKLEEDGHGIKIVITNKDVPKSLHDLYNITYIGETLKNRGRCWKPCKSDQNIDGE